VTPGEINRFTPLDQLPELCSAAEVSRKLNCSVGLVYESVKRGTLAGRWLGRLLFVPRQALIDWANGASSNGNGKRG
jgi:hypothetical protein